MPRPIQSLLLCLLVIMTQPLFACENGLKTLFAPAFGKAFLESFLQEEIKVIQSISDCDPIIISTNSYSDMLRHFREHEYDIAFIPSLYAPYVSQIGYERLLSGFDIVGLIVVRSDSDIYTLKDIQHHKVLMNDEFSQATADWYSRIHAGDVSHLSTLSFGGKMETLLYQLLNKQADVTFSIEALFNKLSPEFQSKLRIIDKKNGKKSASIMIGKGLSSEDRKRMSNLFLHASNRWTIDKPETYYVPEAMHLKILNKLGIE